MASDLGEKTPGKERRHKYQQKTHFEAKRMRPGRAELPVHHSEALWMATKAPRATLCGISTLPRANATSPCQVLGAKTRKFTPLKHTHTHIKKYQQNWSIKRPHSQLHKAIKAGWYKTKQCVLCSTAATRSEAEVQVRSQLYVLRKEANNWDSGGKI